ncbi:MAG TPA: NAD-dependent epimerase/dehydratase family protein, partial [Fibrobacteria bacterium]|nr:NAD-dependent epimerase/dehydratase family protein [Fibrobacteria bacterium]
DIVMLSDGKPRRTFCYVADAVAGYFRMLVFGRDGEPYNIGIETPEISVAELADKLVAIAGPMLGYQGKVVRKESGDKEYLVDNPERRCPTIRKAREHFGYNPSIGLDEGLKRTMLWYRENREGSEA